MPPSQADLFSPRSTMRLFHVRHDGADYGEMSEAIVRSATPESAIKFMQGDGSWINGKLVIENWEIVREITLDGPEETIMVEYFIT